MAMLMGTGVTLVGDQDPLNPDDRLEGTDFADNLQGLTGNDVLIGGEGDDTLIGGEGDDTLIDYAGSNLLDGGAGDDLFQVGIWAGGVVEGGDGIDTLQCRFHLGYLSEARNVEILKLTDGWVEASAAVLGSFSAIQNASDPTTAVELHLTGGGSLDLSAVLGAQAATVVASDAGNAITTGSGDDTLVGGAGDDVLLGGDGNDVLRDGAGTNHLDGGAGDDTFHLGDGSLGSVEGGTGEDRLIAGGRLDPGLQISGVETLCVDGPLQATTVQLDGFDRIRDAHDVTASVWMQLTDAGTVDLSDELGSVAATVVASDGGNTIITGAGDDLLTGRAGDDTLIGGDGADTLLGGAGNDVLSGLAGSDRMEGGVGDDAYVVDDPLDQVVELADEGNDVVHAGISYVLADNIENLVLQGTGALDGTGNALGNRLDGNEAANVLLGLGGDDALVGNGGNDVLDGGEGDDTLDGGDGDDVLSDLSGRNSLSGGAGNDTFDHVSAGSGRNILTGGTGRDTFVLGWHVGEAEDGTGVYPEADHVTDFEPGAEGDVIDISGLLGQFPGGLEGRNPFVDGALLLVQSGAATEVRFDPTGTGADWHTVLVLENTTVADLTEANFWPAYPFNQGPLAGGIADQEVAEDTAWSFTVPAGTFTDPDGESMTCTAALADGDPLPGWIRFDAATRTFSGTPPEDWNGTLGLAVTATDEGHLSVTGRFDLVVLPVNDAPVAVTLTGIRAATDENGGAVKVADIDVADDGQGANALMLGGADASCFEIRGAELWFTGGADFEAKASYEVQVLAGDATVPGSQPVSQGLTLAIGDVNEAPTAIAVEGGSVQENAPAGTVVATLGAVDPDRGDSFVYGLIGGAGIFEIVGNQVRVATGAQIDYEAQSSYHVTLTVTDSQGASHSQDLVIAVGDLNETVVIGGLGNDDLRGTGAADTITGSGGNDRLSGGTGADLLDGGTGSDVLDGGTGPDRLLGGDGNDILWGGRGNDALLGGKGRDQLWGQGGNDTFVFTDATDSGPAKAVRDTIGDFGGKDRIDLRAIDAIGGRGNQAFRLDLDGSFDAGEIRQARVGGSLLLEMNLDGDSKAEMSILLKGVEHPLTASDFLL